MNYFYVLKRFEEWLAENSLPTTPQLMMYKLINLFNSRGWKEWLVADNLYLMSICGLKSERTFKIWRDYLVKEGLIEYLKVAKNKPNKYKLGVNFTEEEELSAIISDIEPEKKF